jgi:hypothetical protein
MFNYGNTFDPDYMKPHAINELEQNFIHGYFLNEEDMWMCSALKILSESSKSTLGNSLPSKVLDDPKLFEKWGKLVTKITNNYYKKFPEASAIGLVELEPPMLHYFAEKTGRGISIEKDRGYEVSTRHLGYITFLDDIPDGGDLVWYFQGLKIKPEKGLTIVFPANWSYINTISPTENTNFNVLCSWTRLRESTGSRLKVTKPTGFDVDSPVKYDFEKDFLDI